VGPLDRDRKATGESAEVIRPDLIIPTGKREGHSPSLAGVYRALAEHDKAATHPDAVEQAHTELAHRTDDDIPRPVRARIASPDAPPTLEELDLRRRLIPRRAETPDRTTSGTVRSRGPSPALTGDVKQFDTNAGFPFLPGPHLRSQPEALHRVRSPFGQGDADVRVDARLHRRRHGAPEGRFGR